MEKIINTIGLCIIASKYAIVLLVAGITFSTGALATELLLCTGLESSE
ncbi:MULTISPECIES: hypothetical protein [Vibrio]|jgi:hypothetical protein|uniref:Uncharacterized protein n=1 Tax=Vibrio barjaei TaxID=1676683 RepID=A0ABW7INX5_9VIBR|nr:MULTISPECIES: hypothetical protein [Vibrio]EDL54617.1 hypothetical protein VSAK1_20709 [Vibrio mediterranei AK1]MCF4172239.1 hypothetical protein [Vibrio sp. McD22-P3]MCG9627861.1 hypothetical protein [Vibrio mediterranei]MCG9659351.1 hypothetical protein [Vibrio mediterranei]MCG9663993.1 hypothetical protein [Vibrio mediterranei]